MPPGLGNGDAHFRIECANTPPELFTEAIVPSTTG